MLRKIISVFAFAFLMAIAIPVLAQRYGSCDTRGGNRGYASQRSHGNYDNYNRRDNGRRDRRANYRRSNNYNNGYYGQSYYPQTYYAPSTYYVRRRVPVRRVYSSYGRRPYNNRGRGRISFSIGF